MEGIYNIVASKDGYTGTGDLNRLTAIQTINEKFFRTIPEKLFGYGLGNCDYASVDFLTTSFYRMHYRLHYTWMSTAIVFLELGSYVFPCANTNANAKYAIYPASVRNELL